MMSHSDTAFDGGDEGVLESVEAIPLGRRRCWFDPAPAAQYGDVLGHAAQELFDPPLIDHRGAHS